MKDFDAMFAEMRGERIPFRAYGASCSIPASLPADVVLELCRREADESLDAATLFRLAGRIFGEKTLRFLCSHEDFTLEKLESMLAWAFDACCGAQPVTEDDKRPKA